MSSTQEIENKSNEAMRLTILELLRTPENSRFIEEARISGASVEETARKTIQSMIQSDDAAPKIAAYIKGIEDRANDLIKRSVRQGGAYMCSDEAATSGTPNIVDEVYSVIKSIKDASNKDSFLLANQLSAGSSQNSLLRKDEQTMSNQNQPNAEAQRISDLESMRTLENSQFIDAGIASGEAAGDVALKIVKAEREEEESIQMMVEYAEELIAQKRR